MTVIAGRIDSGSITLACDSRYTRGYSHGKNTGYPIKIVRGNDFIVGASGDGVILPLLNVFAKNHSIGAGEIERINEWCFEFLNFVKNKTENWHQEDVSLLIAHSSGLFMVYDWLAIPVTDYAAIGSGTEYAEAAMYLGHSPAKAVDVAIQMAYGCGGEIYEETIATHQNNVEQYDPPKEEVEDFFKMSTKEQEEFVVSVLQSNSPLEFTATAEKWYFGILKFQVLVSSITGKDDVKVISLLIEKDSNWSVVAQILSQVVSK